MKNNKKLVGAVLITMIFSVSLIQGIKTKISNSVSHPSQQVSIGAGYMAGSTSGGTMVAWASVSAVTGGAAGTIAYGALVNSWNPAGWVGWAVAGGAAL